MNESQLAQLIIEGLKMAKAAGIPEVPDGLFEWQVEPEDRTGDILVITEHDQLTLHIRRSGHVPPGYALVCKPLAERS